MADNIFITGAADGAFETALGDLPPWATEDTALSIESILRKSLGIQTKALSELIRGAKSKGGSGQDPKKLNDELDKLIKNFRDENTQARKRKQHNEEDEKEAKRKKKRGSEDQEVFNKKLFIDTMLIKAGFAIKNVFEDNVKTFNALTAAGISVMDGMNDSKDGFDSIRQLTVLTGVRFTELAASIQKYSSSVNSFGMGKFAKTVGMASTNLTQFGFSSKESADLLGAYLSTQQNVTDVSRKTAAETNEDLQKFGKSVFRLSIATGMSRTAIIANAEAISKSTEANLLAGQIGEKTAASMTTFLASFKDQNVAKQILKLMSDPIKPLNESFMNLQKVGMGGFAQTFTQFTKSLEGMPEETKQQALKSFIEAHRGELEQNKQRLALLKQAGVAEAGAALDLVVGLTQQADAIKRMTPEEIKRHEASNEASKNLANSWEKLQSLFQRTFAPTAGMLNMLSSALNGVIWALEGVSKGFEWVDDQLNSLAATLGFADANMDLTPWIGLAAIGYALYKSMTLFGVGLKTIAAAMKTTLFGGKKSLTEAAGGAGGRAGARAAGGIGGGIAGLGKGIGKGVGSALSGLAAGLKKLGDPKVLLGVVALAGIAGALFITGKAIQEFTKTSWEDLAKAGVALIGLTLGIMALGAIMSSGVGTIAILAGAAALVIMAGALWILGKGIQAIGTGFEMLKKGMDAIGSINTGQVLNITKGLLALGLGLSLAAPGLIIGAAGLTAIGLAAAIAVPAFGSLGSNISLLSRSLGSFKGLDTLKSIVETINKVDTVKALTLGAISAFTGVSLPAPSPTTGRGPNASPKASTINSPSAVSTNPDKTGDQAVVKETTKPPGSGIEQASSKDSINTALGYQSSILEQLLLSTNNLVSVNKDILKYSRVNS